MKTGVKLTVIYDNNSLSDGLRTDWGFACLIEAGKTKILFDTGDNGKILLDNMEKLEINPQNIDILFLSHQDHDHTGGMTDFLKVNPGVKVYYPHSFPSALTDLIERSGAVSVPVSELVEILPDIYSLGEIAGKIPEQSLAVRSSEGLILVTGCAHPGIVNILEKMKSNFPDELICLIAGGFHLHRFDEEEIKNVVQKIVDMDVLSVAPTHCSGDPARNIFREIFGSDYIETGTGKIIEII